MSGVIEDQIHNLNLKIRAF